MTHDTLLDNQWGCRLKFSKMFNEKEGSICSFVKVFMGDEELIDKRQSKWAVSCSLETVRVLKELTGAYAKNACSMQHAAKVFQSVMVLMNLTIGETIYTVTQKAVMSFTGSTKWFCDGQACELWDWYFFGWVLLLN